MIMGFSKGDLLIYEEILYRSGVNSSIYAGPIHTHLISLILENKVWKTMCKTMLNNVSFFTYLLFQLENTGV